MGIFPVAPNNRHMLLINPLFENALLWRLRRKFSSMKLWVWGTERISLKTQDWLAYVSATAQLLRFPNGSFTYLANIVENIKKNRFGLFVRRSQSGKRRSELVSSTGYLFGNNSKGALIIPAARSKIARLKRLSKNGITRRILCWILRRGPFHQAVYPNKLGKIEWFMGYKWLQWTRVGFWNRWRWWKYDRRVIQLLVGANKIQTIHSSADLTRSTKALSWQW